MAAENADQLDFVADLSISLSVEQRLEKATQLKDKGNKAFDTDDYHLALKYWHHALLYSAGINSFATLYGSKSTDAQNTEAANLTSTIYNNMAACYIRQTRWDKAVYASSKTLAVSPKNMKALYRRAQAYLELRCIELAAKDVDQALDLTPNDPKIRQLGERLLSLVEEVEQGQGHLIHSDTT